MPLAVVLATGIASSGLGSELDLEPDLASATTTAHPRVEVEIDSAAGRVPLSARPALLGDLGGLRPLLARHGMSLEISSLDESFSHPDVATSTGEDSRYAGLTDVVFTIDTSAAGWWPGGSFVVDLQDVRGGDISACVGDVQGVSNIVAPEGTRFAEYFLDQQLGGGRYRIKVGKQDANADFVVSDGGGEFLNSSFGLIPTVPLPTFPAPAFGVMGAWAPRQTIVLKAGYWDGTPEVESGFSTAVIHGHGGTVAALGVEVRPFGNHILPGTYRAGIWRHSEVEVHSEAKSSAGAPTATADGIYFTADQALWERDGRSLAVFAQGGWAEAGRSPISRYLGGGVTLSGPLKARPHDLVGIALASAEITALGAGAASSPSETVVELFYRFPVAGWMSLIPDLQWIHQPGGADHTTFVAALRVATAF